MLLISSVLQPFMHAMGYQILEGDDKSCWILLLHLLLHLQHCCAGGGAGPGSNRSEAAAAGGRSQGEAAQQSGILQHVLQA
jgi:hypothetical protein